MKLLTLIIINCVALFSHGFSALVSHVTDGDTIKIEYENKQIIVRLAGIDTPEIKQPFGTESKEALIDKVINKEVVIEGEKKDRYGRLIADIKVNDRWINRELVEEGFAWHYKKYSKDTQLAEAELSARELNRGLWKDENPIPPWEYRKLKKVL